MRKIRLFNKKTFLNFKKEVKLNPDDYDVIMTVGHNDEYGEYGYSRARSFGEFNRIPYWTVSNAIGMTDNFFIRFLIDTGDHCSIYTDVENYSIKNKEFSLTINFSNNKLNKSVTFPIAGVGDDEADSIDDIIGFSKYVDKEIGLTFDPKPTGYY